MEIINSTLISLKQKLLVKLTMDLDKDALKILGLFDTEQIRSLNLQMEKILLFIKKIVLNITEEFITAHSITDTFPSKICDIYEVYYRTHKNLLKRLDFLIFLNHLKNFDRIHRLFNEAHSFFISVYKAKQVHMGKQEINTVLNNVSTLRYTINNFL